MARARGALLLIVASILGMVSSQASGEAADSTNAVTCVLPRGRVVDVRFPTALCPRELRADCAIDLEIAHDVRVDDALVFVEGALARGRVESVRKRQAAGYPAQLTIVVESATAVDGTSVPLTGVYSTVGQDRHVEAAGIALFFCVCGLLIPGEDVLIDKGTVVPCFVAGDTVVTPREVRDG